MRPYLALKLLPSLSHSNCLVHTKPSLSLSRSPRFPGYPDRNDVLGNMRTTRSATRKAAAIVEDHIAVPVEETVAVVVKKDGKRKASSETREPVQKRSRATASSSTKPTDKGKDPPPHAVPTIHIEPIPAADGEELVPAVLTFSFEDAKRHLIGADPRFQDMFGRVSCKPFEELERVDPFRCV